MGRYRRPSPRPQPGARLTEGLQPPVLPSWKVEVVRVISVSMRGVHVLGPAAQMAQWGVPHGSSPLELQRHCSPTAGFLPPLLALLTACPEPRLTQSAGHPWAGSCSGT